MSAFSPLDMKLIRLLQGDARRSVASMARELGVNEATVRRHIDRLIEEKIVDRFTIVLDYHKLGRVIKAFVGLRVQPQELRKIVDHLSKHPDIHTLYRTSGDMDVLAEVLFETMEELNSFLETELVLEGIVGTNVMIVIGPYKRCPWTGL
mgnify:CR=1 FL=1